MGTPKKDETLEKWRKSKGWSQSELGEKLGKKQRTVSGLENGESATPEVEAKLRELGFTGELGRRKAGLVDALDEIEGATQILAARGFAPPDPAAAHEMRKLIGLMLENSRGPESLADQVERVIRLAQAIRK